MSMSSTAKVRLTDEAKAGISRAVKGLLRVAEGIMQMKTEVKIKVDGIMSARKIENALRGIDNISRNLFLDNEIIKKWSGNEIKKIRDKIAEAKSAIKQEQYDKSSKIMDEVVKEAKEAKEHAQDLESKERQRVYIAESILQSVEELGFVNFDARLVDPNDLSGTIIVTAEKLSGKSIHIILNSDGDIETDYQGYEGKACKVDAKNLRNTLKKYGITFEDEQEFYKKKKKVQSYKKVHAKSQKEGAKKRC